MLRVFVDELAAMSGRTRSASSLARAARLFSCAGFAASLLVLGFGAQARAQSASDVVEKLNRDALEAYNALEINKAGAMLEEALRVGAQGGVAPQLMARTNANMGVVIVGGLSDKDGGFPYFLQALCLDPSIQLDPLTSTPDIQSVYAAAVQQAQAGACGGPPGAGPGGPGPMMPTEPTPPPPDQAMLHQAPLEQLAQTPLPLYVEVHPLAGAKEIFLFFKGTGMEKHQRVPMYSYQNGFAYQVSCNDIWQPSLEYYIEAHDGDGGVVGFIGTAKAPITVPIVGTRTQAEPALPGATPPSSCGATECPPGVKGCAQPGTAAIGDECSADPDCQSGLFCAPNDECMLIGAGSTEVPAYDPETGTFQDVEEASLDDPDDFKRTFIQLGFTLGFAYLMPGMPADRPSPDDRVFVNELGNAYIDNPLQAVEDGRSVYFPEPGTISEPALTAWVPDGNSLDSLNMPLEGNCDAEGRGSGPSEYLMSGDSAMTRNPDLLFPDHFCVRIRSSGFVINPALRLNVGHFITERIGLAGLFRFQFSAGEGTLASMLLGARVEYIFTEPRSKGLILSGLAGGSVGQIQAKPPADGKTEGAPYAKSGLFGAHVGAMVRYRFSPSIGVFASPELDVQLPSFLLNVDLTLLGVEAAF